jgi:AcrR family transcriptional regulator
MTTTLSQRERQKIARREAILQAARRVFLSGQSFQGTVETVAQEAGVSKGTVYLYFSSKEALLAEILREGLLLLEAQLVAAYAGGETLTPDVRVARVAGAYLEFAQAQPDYIRLGIAFSNGQLELSVSNEQPDDIGDLSMRGVKLIEQAVREGVDQKVFRRTNPRQVAVALWSALDGALLMTGDPQRADRMGIQIDTLFQVTLEMFLRALKRTRK